MSNGKSRKEQGGSSTPARTYFLFFLLIVFVSPCSFAQDTTATSGELPDSSLQAVAVTDTTRTDSTHENLYRLNGHYLKSYWTDFKGVVARPAHWKLSDWGKLAAVGVTAGVLMQSGDRQVRSLMLRNQKPFFTSAGKVIEPLGNQVSPLLITGMYLTGVLTQNRQLEHSSLSIARSVVISTVLYTASKQVIRRQRPVRTDNPKDFAQPFSSDGYTSFPSGHSNTIFSVATALALEYKEVKWVPWVAYSVATLTALTRLYQNRHWASDVVVGASLGHFVTKTVYRLEEKRKNEHRPTLTY